MNCFEYCLEPLGLLSQNCQLFRVRQRRRLERERYLLNGGGYDGSISYQQRELTHDHLCSWLAGGLVVLQPNLPELYQTPTVTKKGRPAHRSSPPPPTHAERSTSLSCCHGDSCAENPLQ